MSLGVTYVDGGATLHKGYYCVAFRKNIYESNHTPTAFQFPDRDYLFKCKNDLFWIEEHEKYHGKRGIAQFPNRATPDTMEQEQYQS